MIVDHRTYTLKPGAVGAYFAAYEKQGLKIQLKHLGRLVGYFVSEVGPLNQIVHIWAYESLAERDQRRGAMQADPKWQAWVKNSRDYFLAQENKILKEAPFSHVKWTGPKG
ncbi:MAG: NIPSNAP family protein [Proteobacteria bacterium]|nr:NIPSNAP family protein [Pseudomonadota bacterium]MBI3498838.1 NIPSNAP family protein [Pseudomonadota bacterium]